MQSKIVGKMITDIYTVGYIDIEDGVGTYYPDLRWIYLEFDNILLEFESYQQYSRLRVQEVEEIRYLFEFDEDIIRAKSSIRETILVSSFLNGNIVKKVEFKDNTENDCSAVKIILENKQIIFIDPTFPYGIGIGGKEQEDYWKFANS